MRTRSVLWVLLSLVVGPVQAQVPASPDRWRVDAAVQRERDASRKLVLEEELAAEARQFAEAHAELREARARRVVSGQMEVITERLDRHRRNMRELAGEIARAERDMAPAGSGPTHAAERLAHNWLIAGQATLPRQADGATGYAARKSLSARNRDEPARPEWIIPARELGRFQ